MNEIEIEPPSPRLTSGALLRDHHSPPVTRFRWRSEDASLQPTCSTQRTSGRELVVGSIGPSRQKTWCAGASDNIWRSLGEFYKRHTLVVTESHRLWLSSQTRPPFNDNDIIGMQTKQLILLKLVIVLNVHKWIHFFTRGNLIVSCSDSNHNRTGNADNVNNSCSYEEGYRRLWHESSHLVVWGHIEGHETLQEHLWGLVVGEQCVTVHVVEVTWGWHWTPWWERLDTRRVETQQVVEPRLHRVTIGVADRLNECHFVQDATWHTNTTVTSGWPVVELVTSRSVLKTHGTMSNVQWTVDIKNNIGTWRESDLGQIYFILLLQKYFRLYECGLNWM